MNEKSLAVKRIVHFYSVPRAGQNRDRVYVARERGIV